MANTPHAKALSVSTDPGQSQITAWPRDTKFARRCFALLNRAYVDARYSPRYEITDEELAWLVERVTALQESVAAICAERLESPGVSQPES